MGNSESIDPLQVGPQPREPYGEIEPDPIIVLPTSQEDDLTFQVHREAAIDQPSLVYVLHKILHKRTLLDHLLGGPQTRETYEASVGVREGKSNTVSIIAENLKPQEAVKLVAEHTKRKVSVSVTEGNSDRGYFFAENLKPQQVGKLVAELTQGKIDLEELREQEWREVEGGLTRFFNSVGEVATETAISVASGILGGYMVTIFGPVGAIAISLGAAAAERKSQENSVGPGILGGALVSSFGPVGAIVIPLGAAAAATTFKKT